MPKTLILALVFVSVFIYGHELLIINNGYAIFSAEWDILEEYRVHHELKKFVAPKIKNILRLRCCVWKSLSCVDLAMQKEWSKEDLLVEWS